MKYFPRENELRNSCQFCRLSFYRGSKMSLRSCITILPGVVKTLKPNTIHQFNTSLQNITKRSHPVLWFTTDHKPPETQSLKEIYYGILTPQIKAVKVF